MNQPSPMRDCKVMKTMRYLQPSKPHVQHPTALGEQIDSGMSLSLLKSDVLILLCLDVNFKNLQLGFHVLIQKLRRRETIFLKNLQAATLIVAYELAVLYLFGRLCAQF
jgi:hypothetical protein